MKIQSIEVHGFGIFSDRYFDVNAPVTLLYGHNEAGKSTLMQFVRFLFFGFPERTRPEQRYLPVRGGRHGGAVRFVLPNGHTYRLERSGERGSRPLLYDGDGAAVDEAELSELFGGMTADAYRRLFAFGLDELQEIGTLQGEEVSRYLFDAGIGAGAGQLLRAEKRLRAEMDRLYRPRGTTQPIYHLVKAIEQSRKEMAESILRQDGYEKLVQQIEQCESEIARIEGELEEAGLEAARLETALDLRERWLRHKEIAAELAAIPPHDDLLPDAVERYDQLGQEKEQLSARIALLEQEMIAAEDQMAKLEPDRVLLSMRDKLEQLLQQAGVYEQQREQAAKLRSQIEARTEAIRVRVRRLNDTWTEDDLLRLSASVSLRAEAAQIRSRMAEAEAAIARAEDEAGRLRQQAERERGELAEREQARWHVERKRAEALAEYGNPDSFLRDSAAFLDGWEQFRSMYAELEQIDVRLNDLAVHGAAFVTANADASPRRKKRERRTFRRGQFAVFALAIALPVALWFANLREAALAALVLLIGWSASILFGAGAGGSSRHAQDARDSFVKQRADELLHRRARLAEELHATSRTLDHLFRSLQAANPEAGMAEAAAAVANPAANPAANLAATAAATTAATTFATTAATVEPVQQNGAASSVSIAMLDQAPNIARIARWAAQLEETRKRVQDLERERQAHADSVAAQRRRTEASLAALEAAEKRYAQLRAQALMVHDEWQAWLEQLGLPASLLPEDALDLIQEARELLQLRAEREERKRELQALESEWVKFVQDVAQLVDVEDEAAIPALLRQRMEEVMTQAEREQKQRELARRQEERKVEMYALLAERERVEQNQQHLLAQCGAADENELMKKDEERKRRQMLEAEARQNQVFFESWLGAERYREADKLLERHGGEELSRRLEQWRTKLNEAEGRLNELRHEHGALTMRRQQLQAEGDLAAKRLKYEANVAELQETAERWAVRAFALELFRLAKERYERDRQPQVLKEASRYFGEMTDGRYRRVLAPIGENRLVAERSGGALINTGSLSRGTAEQLYLAMRLALAGEYAAKGTAMPLVMDDVFVNFDGERLKSTLKVLCEVSRRHQILLFTCHDHIAEAAATVIDDLKTVRIDQT